MSTQNEQVLSLVETFNRYRDQANQVMTAGAPDTQKERLAQLQQIDKLIDDSKQIQDRLIQVVKEPSLSVAHRILLSKVREESLAIALEMLAYLQETLQPRLNEKHQEED